MSLRSRVEKLEVMSEHGYKPGALGLTALIDRVERLEENARLKELPTLLDVVKYLVGKHPEFGHVRLETGGAASRHIYLLYMALEREAKK
mgnify:CR=1 FL=1|jgi:hypothetical protein